MPTTPLRQRPAWKALEQHHAEIAGRHLRELFAEDPGRGERLTAEAAGLYLDYSKNRVTDETMRLLVRLAEESGLAAAPGRDVRRRARSTCPRTGPCCTSRCGCPKDSSLVVDGVDVVAQVHEVLDRMASFAESGAFGPVEGIHRQGRSGTSSTSASAARTSGR